MQPHIEQRQVRDGMAWGSGASACGGSAWDAVDGGGAREFAEPGGLRLLEFQREGWGHIECGGGGAWESWGEPVILRHSEAGRDAADVFLWEQLQRVGAVESCEFADGRDVQCGGELQPRLLGGVPVARDVGAGRGADGERGQQRDQPGRCAGARVGGGEADGAGCRVCWGGRFERGLLLFGEPDGGDADHAGSDQAVEQRVVVGDGGVQGRRDEGGGGVGGSGGFGAHGASRWGLLCARACGGQRGIALAVRVGDRVGGRCGADDCVVQFAGRGDGELWDRGSVHGGVQRGHEGRDGERRGEL